MMAVTGVVMVLFVVTHLLGNLQIFLGQDAFNDYAAFLHSIPELLWPARIGLLAAFIGHFAVAFALRNKNKAARPEGYHVEKRIQASAASIYMFETGLVIFFFVIIHLLHFTFTVLQPQFADKLDAKGRYDVYSMVINGFHNGTYSAFYIFCMVMVGIHMSHAIGSMFATFGFGRPGFRKKADAAGRLVAALIALGYISIPLASWTGLLRLPG